MNEKIKLSKGLLKGAEANEKRAAAQTGGEATEDTKAVRAQYLVEKEGLEVEPGVAGAHEEDVSGERSEKLAQESIARIRDVLRQKDPEGVPNPDEDRYHNLSDKED